MAITIERFSNPLLFRDAVFPFLLEAEAKNCLGLGVTDNLISQPDFSPSYHLLAFKEGEKVVGAAWMTVPFPLGISDLSEEAMDLLIDETRSWKDPVGKLVGPSPTIDTFADKWINDRGVSISSRMAQRIYQLSTLIPPREVKGKMRLPTDGEQSLLEDWIYHYSLECHLPLSRDEARAHVKRTIKARSRQVWEDEGRLVSMLGISGHTPRGARITAVYTPPELRGRGYASMLVAAASAKLLAEGKSFTFLYTDLSNPTSNSIYQKLGYKAVCDSVMYEI